MEEIDWVMLRGIPSFRRFVWNEAW